MGWLYLPGDQEWGLETRGKLLNLDEMDSQELDNEGTPLIAIRQNLVESLDNQTIEDIVRGAKQIENPPSDDLLLEVFLYYYKYDAFLPKRGYVPPSREEVMAKLDRDFFDSLGSESPSEKCRKEGCNRGKVTSSVFCRVHHFEMVKRKPCPFTD